jgi:hypothetical protein
MVSVTGHAAGGMVSAMPHIVPPVESRLPVHRRRMLLSVMMTATVVLTGCNSLKKYIPVFPSSVSKGTQTDDTPLGGISDPHLQIQLLTVHVQGPNALGNGTLIVADQAGQSAPDATGTGTPTPGPTATPSAIRAFGVLQAATTPDLPIQNAFVGVHGYDFKVISQLSNRYTTADGTTYFKYVPARIAFFLDAEISVKGQIYHELGLTRTPEEGLNSDVTIDVASTLVARELLRIWQMTGYFVSYKDLSAKDFNPLLATLRSVLRAGIPADLKLDLSTVNPPSGVWSIESDRQDGALVFLSQLAQRQPAVNAEIDRIYEAANISLCNCRDTSKYSIKRPDPL